MGFHLVYPCIFTHISEIMSNINFFLTRAIMQYHNIKFHIVIYIIRLSSRKISV